MKKGIIVRSMVSYHLPAYIRVSVGTPEQNARFLAELPGGLEGLVSFTPPAAGVGEIPAAAAVPAAKARPMFSLSAQAGPEKSTPISPADPRPDPAPERVPVPDPTPNPERDPGETDSEPEPESEPVPEPFTATASSFT
jgi:hypothetical protein